MTLIDISEPSPQSKAGFTTIHDRLLKGKRIGHVEEYIQKNEVKTLWQYTKRKLFVGQTFGTQIFLDVKENGVPANKPGKNSLLAIVASMKDRFDGLEERDFYILELGNAGKKII